MKLVFHFGVQIPVPTVLLLTQFPANLPEKAMEEAHVLGLLQRVWEITVKFLAPGFDLA